MAARLLEVYLDLLSQPCRAVNLLLGCTGIPHTVRTVALRRGEQRSPEFTKLNPMQKVPVLVDEGFILTESDAILKYLANKYNVADHWYPRQPEKRARVDEYTAWHHSNTRPHAAKVFILEVRAHTDTVYFLDYIATATVYFLDYIATATVYFLDYIATATVYFLDYIPTGTVYFLDYMPTTTVYLLDYMPTGTVYFLDYMPTTTVYFLDHMPAPTVSLYLAQVLLPTQSGSAVDQGALSRALSQLDDTLDKLESMFLRRQPFLCGDDITVADLLAVCELMQPLGGGRDVLKDRPPLQRWRSRVQSAVGEHFDRAHAVLFALRDRRARL